MLVIIDYGLGNLGSVVNAFNYLGIEVKLSNKKRDINKASGLILPGVGAFGEGIKNLRRQKLAKPLLKNVKEGKPLLGICLGLQLLFTTSQEDPGIDGLNLLTGTVEKFSEKKIKKIPHIGWNQIDVSGDDPLFKGIKPPGNFYFVHSYYVKPDHRKYTLGETVYSGCKFTSVVRKDNIWGIQCHPEKSSKIGLKLLKNFSEVVDNGGYSGS